ncbi:MAG TPA: BrnT family toxin [Thermodesulfobacteriota bacterium]
MIKWDEYKNLKLFMKRGVSFAEIEQIILNEEYIEILEHPKKDNQYIFIVDINNYIWAVPFVIEGETIFLKTAFPSRKFNKIYKREAKKDEQLKK